ncbi:MAG: glycosyltransferase [Desmonostoc vinosum HA7617-LM4]|jgi:glycosyltransferase involved in cell wall biosynthesis|nr:glycosyltransferase [Desmonostoc vinosum HA7617-LM4]
MRKPILTIFYQFNPWHTTIGGIQTLIGLFIKYAPKEFVVRLVGTGNDRYQQVLKWQETEFAGRELSFLPLFTLENDNIRHLVPTTVRYTTALLGRCFASDFMHFYRLEPTLATFNWQGEKTLFIQNDIQRQMAAKDDNNAILWRRFPAGYFALESLLVKQFHQILSCNTNSLELYQQRYPSVRERIAYLKNTFDEEIFYPLPRQERDALRQQLATKIGLAADTRFVLFAGRLHPQKDPLLLIRSFAALNKPNIHLLIAGDGELANQINSEIEQLGLSKRVTMLGVLKQEELAHLHRICSVLVLTSAFEGLPFVVLEALACGTPIVTTDSGDTAQLLFADSGVICKQRTPECIADGLRQVLLHPENYPSESCVRTVSPYAARTVISSVYGEMLNRWESRTLSAMKLKKGVA